MSIETSTSPLSRFARPCNGRGCGAWIAFALTPTGKRMPIDLDPDPAGNVAVRVDAHGVLRARVLAKGEQAEPGERVHVPHFATCGPVAANKPRADGVIPLYRKRAVRRRTP